MPKDPAIVNLVKAIAMQEGGGSPDYTSGLPGGKPAGAAGEIGAYQWMPGHFQELAKQYGFDPTDMSPQNQNQVAYAAMADYYTKQKASGNQNPAAATASWWNSGDPNSWQPGTVQKTGDTPGYVAGVSKYYKQFSASQAPAQASASSGNWLIDAIKGFGGGIGNDFMSFSPQRLSDYLKGPANPDFWSEIGGNVNALSDVAMGTGILVGDIASGGADVPLDPAEIAAGVTARNVAEKGAVAGVKKLAQSTVGRFAAGKGAGLAAQGVSSAVSSAAETKGKGGTDVQAAESGFLSGVVTVGTFGLMNKYGPKVANGFVNLISKSKVGAVIGKGLNAAADYIKSATNMSTLEDTGVGIEAKLNAAAEQVVAASSKALGGMVSELKTPTAAETGAMAQRVSTNVYEAGNKTVENAFQRALTALSKFKLTSADVKGVESELAAGTGKITSMAEAAASDATATVEQRSQMLMTSFLRGGSETVDKIINGLNIKSPEAVDATLTSTWWKAIKDVVSKTPEGREALQTYTDAMTARATQNEQAMFADAINFAKAGGWQRITASVFGMLKDAGNVDNLKTALGKDFGAFQKNLTQKIMGDAVAAYQHVVTAANGNITPKVTDDAQKALAKVIDSYSGKLVDLPGLLSAKTIGFLNDMKSGVPTVSTIADNVGADVSKLVSKEGAPLVEQGVQATAKATQQTIDLVRNSGVGKALASGQYSQLPQALLSSSKEEIAALKTLLGPESREWKTVVDGSLGTIMQKVTGLFSPATRDDAEKFLESISAKLGGDAEKYALLFDTGTGKAATSGKAFIENLSNLAGAVKKGSGKLALVKAAGSVLGFAIHHPFMGFMLAKESLEQAVGKENSELITTLMTKTPAQIRTEISKLQVSELSTVPRTLIQAISAINQYLAPILKYEVSHKAGQATGGVVSP